MRNKMSLNKGFSLVEMLVVLIIVGILIGLILPNALKAIRQAHVREVAATLRSIDSAFQVCYSDKRTWASPCDSIAGLTGNPPDDFLPKGTPTQYDGQTILLIGDSVDGRASDKSAFFTNWPDLTTYKF